MDKNDSSEVAIPDLNKKKEGYKASMNDGTKEAEPRFVLNL